MSMSSPTRWASSPSSRSVTFLHLDNDDLGEDNSDKLDTERDSLVSYVGNLDKEIEKQREFCDTLTRDVYNQVQLKYSLIIEEQQHELHRFVQLVESLQHVNHELGNEVADARQDKEKAVEEYKVKMEQQKKMVGVMKDQLGKVENKLKASVEENVKVKDVRFEMLLLEVNVGLEIVQSREES